MRYEYEATVLSVVDGDTVHLSVRLGMDIVVQLKCRLYGINAPEMKTEAGPPAKQHLIGLLGWTPEAPPTIYVRTYKDHTEKYGRYLGTLFTSPSFTGPSVNEQMVVDGHAVRYNP